MQHSGNSKGNLWMEKVPIPLIFCPNPLRTGTGVPSVFCASVPGTAPQPASSWVPPAPEKWLPRWTGKKWWQKSTRDLYLPYFFTKAQRARGTGEKERGSWMGRGQIRAGAEAMPSSFSASLPKSSQERTADSIGLQMLKSLKVVRKAGLSASARVELQEA